MYINISSGCAVFACDHQVKKARISDETKRVQSISQPHTSIISNTVYCLRLGTVSHAVERDPA